MADNIIRTWLRASVISAFALASAVAVTGAERATGYLAPGKFNVYHVLEPAPKAGDPRYDNGAGDPNAISSLVSWRF